ncbi:MAG TPA: ATP-dependent DNA helicase RecG [Streptosporangiaceae bacterium]|nr:ATP-dependent DNA helicase RecG [Streptosporangiaceae bacterium]
MAKLTDGLRPIVGDRAAKRLAVLGPAGLRTVGDLLTYYPRRYETRGQLTDLASLRDGEHVTVQAMIAATSVRPMRNRGGSIFEAVVTDGHGKLTLTFFGKGRQDWRERELAPGRSGLFSGQVSSFRGKRQLSHPEFEMLKSDDSGDARAAEFASELIPIYPASKDISSWQIADSVRLALAAADIDDDPLPAPIRAKHGLYGYERALRAIHQPADELDWRRATKRLKWDEAFMLQVVLAQRRRASAERVTQPRPPVRDGLLAEFDRQLPFRLTAGQRQASEVIAADLASDHPMHRLLQGEVGSGKTIVALRAMLQVIDAAGQAALLAPTEVLAQQHHRSISQLLGPLAMAGQLGGTDHATTVTLLTGSQGSAARRRALLEAASGSAGIVIGTHALLEDQVQFADLGLIVIDEQHRFGVEQREALRAKGVSGRPHVLVMTATPIPRTVAITVFGDLEVSELRELPAGRSPIATHVVPVDEKPHYLARTWERVKEEVAAGRQVYVVCPRIGGGESDAFEASDDGGSDESAKGTSRSGNRGADGGRASARAGAGASEGLAADGGFEFGELGYGDGGESSDDADTERRPAIAVLDTAAELAAGPLTDLRLGVLHGRLAPDEKDKIMLAFAEGKIDVLVTTTVVEVGVDVPNATTMVIMDADRFGVSQLHQLRGRVGRGGHAGLCLLVTAAPSEAPARERLDAVAATTDGFELSRLDLQQRKEGDVLGSAQAGRRSHLKLLTLLSDEKLIVAARHEATELVGDDPALAGQPALATAISAMLDAERTEFLEKA